MVVTDSWRLRLVTSGVFHRRFRSPIGSETTSETVTALPYPGGAATSLAATLLSRRETRRPRFGYRDSSSAARAGRSSLPGTPGGLLVGSCNAATC